MARVTHASYSGWFPFCLKKLDSIPPPQSIPDIPPFAGATFYPIKIDLEDAMRIFWRVKKWKIKAFKLNFPPEIPSFSKEVVVEPRWDGMGNELGLPSEKYIICHTGFEIRSSDPDFDPGSGEDGFGITFYSSFSDYPFFEDSNGDGYRALYYEAQDELDIAKQPKKYIYPQMLYEWGVPGIPLREDMIEFDNSPAEGGGLKIKINIQVTETDYMNFESEEWWTYDGLYDPVTGKIVSPELT